jgi:hypothetical protein
MDFEIEIKENDAKITFESDQKAYLISVADPIEFSVKIIKVVIMHYKKKGDIEKANRVKQSGFNYLTYCRTRIL